MNVWSAAAILEKNKLASDVPFFFLCQIIVDGIEEPILLAANNEDVSWNGKLWQRFPFEPGPITEDGKEIPSLKLQVSNVAGIIQGYVQSFNGFADAEVNLYLVLASNLSSSSPEMEFDYVITETSYNEQWVEFTLGASNDHSYRFPPHRYITNFCHYKFKDIRCGYNGELGECDGTLATCRIPKRFGGEPGLENGS